MTWKPLLWLLGLLPLVWIWRVSLVDRPARLKHAAWALRMASLVLIILALCRPSLRGQSQDVQVLFLLDVSESVDLESARAALDRIQTAVEGLGRRDRWCLSLVGDGLRNMEELDLAREELCRWSEGLADADFRRASTLAHALQAARFWFSADKMRRVVVFSDGRGTDGALEPVVQQLNAEQIDVRWVPLPGNQAAEVCVTALQSNTPQAFVGERVRFTAEVVSNQALEARLRLLHRAVLVQEMDVTLDPNQTNRFDMDVEMVTPGANPWTVEVVGEQDYFTLNNQAGCTVEVGGKPRLLVLHEKPRQIRSWRRSLIEQGLDVEVRGQHGLPESLKDLMAFDGLILADIPATEFSARQMEMIKRYVQDLGGGLLMMGSNNSFGLGGYYRTPVEEVLPLISRYEKEKEQPSMAMVLVIDKSGSMNGEPMALARQAAKATVELLSQRDQIGVVGFDGQAYVVSPMRYASDVMAIQNAIDTLAASGGTSMYPAMATAFDLLSQTSAKIKHVIILSDGQSQPGNFQALAGEMSSAGITLSTVALGHADRQLLASLAEIGRGRYYETTDPQSIPKIFTRETMETSRTAVKEDLYTVIQTADHPILTGLVDEELPLILGYVMTQVKSTAQLLWVADSGDPLLALGRYGLGISMAYTSDMTPTWGGQWLDWDQCGACWAQLLRGMIRHDPTEGFEVTPSESERSWVVDVKRENAAGQPLNELTWDAKVIDATQTVHPVSCRQVALGRYRIEIPLNEYPDDTLALRMVDQDYDQMSIQYHQRTYPQEYNLTNRRDLAFIPMPETLLQDLKQDLIPVTVRRSVHSMCYLLALVALLLGVLLRRV